MRTTESTLRNQLLEAADDTYWRRMRLAHRQFGYGTRTVHELLTHMIAIYGRFAEAEFKEAPWPSINCHPAD
jgi:hypothetical protein